MSIENDLSLIQDFDKNYCLQVFNLLPVAFTKNGIGTMIVKEKKEHYEYRK